MGNDHDYVALEWVRGEMDETLHQARQALETFADNRDDTAQIRFCLNYIHQVHGTLQMVEFYGAALLAEEMEKLAESLMNKRIERVSDAISVLMQAILTLPEYLDHLTAGRKDVPVVLLPVLNDLRACRGESLLSDSSLFTPNLTPARLKAPDFVRHRLQEPKMVEHLKKLRKMYRAALLGIKKERKVDDNLSYLQKVTRRLEKIGQHTAHAEFWAAATALLEMLSAHEIAMTSAIKKLIVDIEHELKVFYDDRDEVLTRPVNEDLLKNILFYIAKSESGLAGPNAIRERFSLGRALSTREEIEAELGRDMGPGKDTIASVTRNIFDELARIKDQLDLYVRSRSREVTDLEEILPGLHQISNTITILGLTSPRQVIDEQIALIEKHLQEKDAPADTVIMDIAGALLYVEGSLAGLSVERKGIRRRNTGDTASGKTGDRKIPAYPGHIEQADDALLREVRNGLEQAKNCIVNYSATNWDKSEIEDAPGILATVKGGLQIIPLEEAAALVDSCNRFVTRALLQSKQPPSMKQLETLADAVTGIEYYLERLAAGSQDNSMILQVAEESVKLLGFPVGAEETWQPVTAEQDEGAMIEPAVIEAMSADKASDDELIDNEIIEIFLEETEEVLGAVNEAYPVFRDTPEDSYALTELRRLFHTLKGSGRLVGATTLGELAWAIENMLNRVIDQTIAPGKEMFELLERVIQRLPDVIDAFKVKKTGPDIAAYVSAAEAIANDKKSRQEVEETEVDLRAARIIRESEGEAFQEPEDGILSRPEEDIRPDDVGQPEDRGQPEDVGQPEDDLVDEEIIEIFLEESEEVLGVVHEQLPVYLADYDNREALAEVRRSFHTLKGSGRMVHATFVGELSWSIENMLNKVIDGAVHMSPDIAELVQKVVAILPDLIDDYKNHRRPSHDTSIYEKQAEALARGEPVAPLATVVATESSDSGTVRQTAGTPEASGLPEDAGLLIDPVLLDIFETETLTHLSSLNEFVNDFYKAGKPIPLTDEVSRALHTLKGSANTASIEPIAKVVVPFEKFAKDARACSVLADQSIIDILQVFIEFIEQGLKQIKTTPQLELPGTRDFLKDLAAVQLEKLSDYPGDFEFSESGKPDPQLIGIFLTEGMDVLFDAEKILHHWKGDPVPGEELEKLVAELKTLADGAEVAQLTDVAELCHALERAYEHARDESFAKDDYFLRTVIDGHETLLVQMDQVAAGLATHPDTELLQRLAGLASERSGRVSPPESDVTLDPELIDIFLEEAEEIIVNSADLLNDWESRPGDTGLVKELRRELHTLKGGARMAEITPIGDLAHEMENIFEYIADGSVIASERLVSLALRCHDELSSMVDMVASSNAVKSAPGLIAELQQVLAAEQAAVEKTETDDLPVPEGSEPLADETEPVDPELIEIFLEEAEELIDSTANSLQNWTDNFDDSGIAKSLQRDLHTLKGGARMANIKPIGDLSHELETLFQSIAEGRIEPSEQIKDLMLECHDVLAGMVDTVSRNEMPEPANHLIESILAHASQGASDAARSDSVKLLITDPDHENLIEIFLDEAGEQVAHVADNIDVWKAHPDNLQAVIDIQRALDSLRSSAKIAGVEPIDNLVSAMADAIGQALEDNASVTEELLTLTSSGASAVADMLAKLAASQPVPRATELINQITTLSLSEERDVSSESLSASDEDTQVLEIFLEEANDLLETIDKLLGEWEKDTVNSSFNQELQRALHTLKGGARLSGLKELGDASHAFESMLIKSASENQPFEGELKENTQKSFDRLTDFVDEVRESWRRKTESVKEAAQPEQTAASPGRPDNAEAGLSGADGVSRMPGRQKVPDGARPPKAAQPAPRPAQQETIRVSAPLIDELVNLAGETSIARGRMETQISDFSHTLDEMTATIERLKEQLRRMDIETEAQVLFRVERENAATGTDYGDDFDPLEMDRYSSIQQLSRALTESASDLMDLKEDLAEKTRDAETLLLQQSRINTELQEGLMKTRMIPFSSMVPRLRRIVRQVSGELGKKVRFDVHNAQGEMDRTVLERMVAPLEHMLRNALDHGIETREQRIQAGKPETGSIDLSLSREGGDIVLQMQDDGGGIPVNVIRKKAIERGLLDENTQISDHEVLQFIMQAGFSTAKKVTQISGRGVGMDVVSSEIKQLGGQISIASEVGTGTTFTVRLPFTVSVNRALMVNTGDDFYAIPLNTIEGIVRVSVYELEEYYKPDAPMYEYAGKKYKLQYIGSLLQSDHKPKLQGQPLPLPVILVRGGEQSMALQVDGLMGSREIVVKSLGVQFSSVRGVSGATILGDGSVVVILDLPALIRADLTTQLQTRAAIRAVEPVVTQLIKPTQVLVVDDSVTVRKVTTRLLQRNGMEVITAKDGVDAVSILQDNKPDIMLLDIEMPRMDGFEVASFVRHDEELQDVPIVMITSRTGQKHKDRAMSIGVNEYLGKPFQEKSLLGTIEKLVKK
ncbi:MAG: hybrid sensor histidine kinase/response regulator [Proteobacteria bacterium]|nr:MAG: hybrid sensor histidine kinase/response regulator [Pseudomonadota bacterium]